ncbi:MAG: AAA family ATPase [Candidatus Heimdallarchaeota archaeon]
MISESFDKIHFSKAVDEFRFRALEFEELLTSFRMVLKNPGEAISRAILIGPPGSGKSFVLQNFQQRIKNQRIIHPKSNILLRCLSVDCQNHSSSKSVVLEIIHQIDPFFYANLAESTTAELQYILADILLAKKEALIIIFDNIDTLVKKEPEEVNSLIYGFQRFSEGKGNEEPNLFSQILVAQDLEFLTELDQVIFRKIVTDVIPFEPYTPTQLYQFLKDEIKQNIRKKIAEETIWFIGLISKGNLHLAFELLHKAEILAQKKRSLSIVPEYIRMVNKTLTNFHVSKQTILELPVGQKLMLLTIARKFKRNSIAFIDFLELPGLFISLCEEYASLQEAKFFSEILLSLEEMALISKHVLGKDIFITMSDISAAELVRFLEHNLRNDRRDKPFFL